MKGAHRRSSSTQWRMVLRAKNIMNNLKSRTQYNILLCKTRWRKYTLSKEFWRRERVWILVCVSLNSSWINIGCELVSVSNEKFPLVHTQEWKKSKNLCRQTCFEIILHRNYDNNTFPWPFDWLALMGEK